MKNLILLLALFYSLPILACPDISGIYECKRFIQGYNINLISAEPTSQITINSETYKIDNKRHELSRDGVTGFYKSSCDKGDKFLFYQSYTEHENGVHQTEATEFYIKDNDKSTLYTQQIFTFGDEGGLILNIDDKCSLVTDQDLGFYE